MLAYSSIAHAGYLLAAFAGLGTSGIAAASFYAAAYAAMKCGNLCRDYAVSGYDEQLPMVDDYRGLIDRSPLLGGLLIFFLVSLVGIPFTADSSASSIRFQRRWMGARCGWRSSVC